MSQTKESPLFVSIPHSGENIPPEVTWLEGLKEETLMRDVDRFVDILYFPVITELALPNVITEWHRYVVDLNRKPDEFDCDAVQGAPQPSGSQTKGLHWSQTTHREPLITAPMEMALHEQLVENYYQPFHDSVLEIRKKVRDLFGVVYHLDLHSMPSLGTDLHPDPGEARADVVVSDQHGQSADPQFKDLVMLAFQKAGFQVAYNWPYVGGGITKTYGEPEKGFHTIQVELNRAQYMNEITKALNEKELSQIQRKLRLAIIEINDGLKKGLDESGN